MWEVGISFWPTGFHGSSKLRLPARSSRYLPCSRADYVSERPQLPPGNTGFDTAGNIFHPMYSPIQRLGKRVGKMARGLCRTDKECYACIVTPPTFINGLHHPIIPFGLNVNPRRDESPKANRVESHVYHRLDFACWGRLIPGEMYRPP